MNTAIKIPHFTIYQTNYPQGKAHSGTKVAIAIKNEISHDQYSEEKKIYLELRAIMILTDRGKVIVCSVCVPPKIKLNLGYTRSSIRNQILNIQ